ncbi:hypothetical protein VNO78_00950 [Psophocarpus tetragonolobus]|uniref:Uncharacterized protein n=1 Tax=Psophocarpus tetragonolobus TaxID=3891 RepID=A0AAN9XUF0_PSOTE
MPFLDTDLQTKSDEELALVLRTLLSPALLTLLGLHLELSRKNRLEVRGPLVPYPTPEPAAFAPSKTALVLSPFCLLVRDLSDEENDGPGVNGQLSLIHEQGLEDELATSGVCGNVVEHGSASSKDNIDTSGEVVVQPNSGVGGEALVNLNQRGYVWDKSTRSREGESTSMQPYDQYAWSFVIFDEGPS